VETDIIESQIRK